MNDTPVRAPNCLKCRYFHVTWDPAFPRGCSVFGIRSWDHPSHEVFRATGKHCPAFEKNSRLREGPG